MADAPDIYPVLNYRDSKESLNFLKNVLGFESIAEHANEAGEVFHAELRLGNGMIMVSGNRTPDPANPWSTAEFGTYVYVEDVDSHYERAKAAGAEIIMEIRDMEYGAREYSLKDTEGKFWSFGNYKPSL
jgi:uncharacterized glyoxalase superfamily protein PhnB